MRSNSVALLSIKSPNNPLMKRKFLLLFLMLSFFITSKAQIRTPEASPAQKLTQTVGVTEVTIEYSRPSLKNRVIFGDLVPYDTLWRMGANWNTKIYFDEPVEVGDVKLEPGAYALYAIPKPSEWEVIFYKDVSNWGLPKVWDEDLVAVRVKGEVMTLPISYDTFTLSIDSVTHDTANLGIIWEKTYVSIALKFATDKIVGESIEEALKNPKATDYYAAAVYYLEADKDMEQAKEWIDEAIARMGKDAEYFAYRQQALINAKLGNRKEAIKAAEKSLKLAEEVGDEVYISLNKKSLEAWRL